jgi:UDP-GlcNAc:undecaprenyl-phosphate GlcNAc-1-phosphate transferase
LSQLWPYLVVFGVAGAVSTAATPLFRRLSLRLGIIDHPKDRGVHERPTPYLGGVAMLCGLGAAIWVAGRLGPFRESIAGSSELKGVLLGAAVIVFVGTLDDAREVSPPAKLAGQILAGSIIYLSGVAMFYFRIPFGDFVVLGRDLAPIATVIWVIGMTNAVNAIDGLDGLAAGVIGLAAAAFFIFSFWFLRQGSIPETSMGPLIAAATAGLSFGFLPWTWNPARIFMGDGGAYLLGLLMASSTIIVGGRTPDVFPGKTYFFFAPLVVPLVILGVAIFDAGFAILRRISARRAWHQADKNHLHHRLLRLGHGHRRAVLILYAWTALLSAVVLVPTFTGASATAFPLLIAGVAVGLFTFLRPTGRGEPGRLTRRERRAARRVVRESA